MGELVEKTKMGLQPVGQRGYALNPFMCLQEMQNMALQVEEGTSIYNPSVKVLILKDYNLEIDLSTPSGMLNRKNEPYSLGDIYLMLNTPKEVYSYAFATTTMGRKYLNVLERSKILNTLQAGFSGISSDTSIKQPSSSASLSLNISLGNRHYAYAHDLSSRVNIPKDILWISRHHDGVAEAESDDEYEVLYGETPLSVITNGQATHTEGQSAVSAAVLRIINNEASFAVNGPASVVLDDKITFSGVVAKNYRTYLLPGTSNKSGIPGQQQSEAMETNNSRDVETSATAAASLLNNKISIAKPDQKILQATLQKREQPINSRYNLICSANLSEADHHRLVKKLYDVERAVTQGNGFRQFSHLSESLYSSQVREKIRNSGTVQQRSVKVIKADKNTSAPISHSRSRANTANPETLHKSTPVTQHSSSSGRYCIIDFICYKRKAAPIIVIPSGKSAVVNRYNIVELLQNGKFVDSNEAFKEGSHGSYPAHSTSTAQTLLHPIVLKHLFKEKERNFHIVESRFTFRFTPSDWERVVAVLIQGDKFQFLDWPFKSITDLFAAIKGCFFLYESTSIPRDVSNWNVKIFRISRSRRYNDMGVFNDFWKTMEEFLLSPYVNRISPTDALQFKNS